MKGAFSIDKAGKCTLFGGIHVKSVTVPFNIQPLLQSPHGIEDPDIDDE